MNAYVLGVDGGGTSTVAWLADAAGRVVGKGIAGGSNSKSVGAESARRALREARAAAFADAGFESPRAVAVACLGLAGFDRPEDKELLAGWIEDWADRFVLVNDAELVLAAGTPQGHGVALIAGTGSICVGRAPDGRMTRAGGWGPLIGDEGSAYRVALDALECLARRQDGRDPTDERDAPLVEEMCAALGIASLNEMVSALYSEQMDRTRIAASAPAVVRAAERGSTAAQKVLEWGASELSDLVRAVAWKLGWEPNDFRHRLPLAVAGTFLRNAPRLLELLVTKCLSDFRADMTEVPEPVSGAIKLALTELRL
jgi:N-acetylglucosamine kinase-like BadF-type ATPase